jgi:hypothetical protein
VVTPGYRHVTVEEVEILERRCQNGAFDLFSTGIYCFGAFFGSH